MSNRKHVSPSINFTEQDFTFVRRSFGITQLGIAGEAQYGRAFTPIKISDYNAEFKPIFGGLNPCTFKNSENVKYEAAYIAKEYLSESDEMYMTRILGLSGYDKGDSWSLSVGGGVDKSSVTSIGSNQFSAEVQFVNGILNNVEFTDSTLQMLYDNGEIDANVFGSVQLTSGDTIEMSDTLYGDCNDFTGARFNATLTEVNEEMICISATTTTVDTTNTTQTVQDCIVNYGSGTVTYGSTFIIEVNNTIILIDQTDNSIEVVNNGVLRVDGGTITHFSDGSIVFSNCTFYLPNGNTLSGSTYKICDLENNTAQYNCENINGENYTISENTYSATIPVVTTGTTTINTQVPSGVITHTFEGTMTNLTGQPIQNVDKTLIITLRSYAKYNATEQLQFNLKNSNIGIVSLDGGKIKPYDDFKLYGVLSNGTPYSYITSFDRNKKNYIGRVFGKSSTLCCDAKTPFYIEELYINMFDKWVAEGKIDCIKPVVCYSQSHGNFKTQYRGAKTPWIVSEVRGNKVYRLLRFHTFSEGDNSNDQIKISIENIKPDTGLFDVKVRQFYDNDNAPVVLETFSRCSLNKFSNSYIANRIGDIHGKYNLQSKYIMVEIDAECMSDAFPCGFEGYPVREYENCTEPMMTYKTFYASTEKSRKVYLGISNIEGIEKDFFDFKGLDLNGNEWTKVSNGFHLDVNAANATVDGLTAEQQQFTTGIFEFQNENDTAGTDYAKVQNRKFTVCAYGGFDGWDIHREDRTNTDGYNIRGSKAIQGLTSGAFDSYAWEDGETVLNSDYYAYLKGIRTFANPEEVTINLLATAAIDSFSHSNLIEETIDMVEEERCDTFYVFNTPDYTLSGEHMLPEDIANNIDGLYESSWVATHSYWGLYNDEENNTKLYLPPTGNQMRIFALTDKTKAPWYAGAGTTRGITSFENLRYKTKISERDILVEGRINPMFFESGNIYIWGNKTMQETETALSSINVRRLLLHIRKLLANVSVNLLFEQNTANIRSQFRDIIRPILENIQQNGGITNFTIEIDDSPESVDRAELNGKICFSPIRAIEQINIGFCLKNTGAEFDNI